MYKPVQSCNHCGAHLTLDDLRRTDCPYCKTVYPHQSMAAQHAQVVGQVMGNVMAAQTHAQDQWRAAYGMPPLGTPPMAPPADVHALVQAQSRRIQRMVVLSLAGMLVLAAAVAILVL